MTFVFLWVFGLIASCFIGGMIETKVYVLEKDTDRYGRLVGVL